MRNGMVDPPSLFMFYYYYCARERTRSYEENACVCGYPYPRLPVLIPLVLRCAVISRRLKPAGAGKNLEDLFWVAGGTAGLLDAVQRGLRRDETISTDEDEDDREEMMFNKPFLPFFSFFFEHPKRDSSRDVLWATKQHKYIYIYIRSKRNKRKDPSFPPQQKKHQQQESTSRNRLLGNALLLSLPMTSLLPIVKILPNPLAAEATPSPVEAFHPVLLEEDREDEDDG
eukprot:gene12352-8480_t